jgi:hypothetical protein
MMKTSYHTSWPGFDAEYNSVVSSIIGRVEPVGFTELYSQLLPYENRLDLQSGGQGML